MSTIVNPPREERTKLLAGSLLERGAQVFGGRDGVLVRFVIVSNAAERARLLDPALVHDEDAVGDGERLRLVVGDVDRRLAGPPLQVEDRVLQGVAQVAVERRERLVEEEDAGVGRQHPGQRDPLLLAAGELGRHAVAVARQLDHARASPARAAGSPSLAVPLTSRPKAMLRATVRCGKRAWLWKARPMLRLCGGTLLTHLIVEADLPRGRLDQPGDHPQRRRLAAAGGTEQRHELAVGDVGVEAIDGDGRPVALGDVDAVALGSCA